jgi:hypothetical protein
VIDLREISRDRLMEWTRAIARWTRLSGTAEERAAAEYAAGELRALGYTTRILTHPAYISLPGRAALRVTHPEQREVQCITHSMGLPTRAGGEAVELVHVGRGRVQDHIRAGAVGKFGLVDGRATPQRALDATRAGARGVVCISGRLPHEMCCSPVWGSPAETTAVNLPRAVLISVAESDGRALRELCARGRVEVHVTADVSTGWTETPIVEAELGPEHPEADATFAMLSGHLDSWYLGAMDNGTANAAMLEVARLMAGRRASLRRGLRVLLWSGHSHGRYSSSAWYADERFVELDERCVHVNADSLGAIGADRFVTNSMPETAALAIEATERAAHVKLDARRVGRNSDQSFFGIGIPTVLGSVSHQEDGSLGWWWHTPEDTLDKIDPARLVRDAGIFVHVVERLLTEPVLPLDYAVSAADIRANLESLAIAAAGRFDLSVPIAEATRLESLCARLDTTRAASGAAHTPLVPAVNICLRQLGRILIPVTYTRAGRHGHDPALDVPFLPKLEAVRRLAAMPADSDAARFLAVDLIRARSEITSALGRACAAVEVCLAKTV